LPWSSQEYVILNIDCQQGGMQSRPKKRQD
jgi:hypothetical protein